MNRAVVTGATSGIGQALAELLLARGWRVFGVGRNQAVLKAMALANVQFVGLRADVTGEASVSRLAKEISRHTGGQPKINALFQCAGGIPGDRLFYNFEATPPGFFEELWRVNLISKFLVARAILPYIARGGCIINVASIAAHQVFPYESSYHATMRAVLAFTEALDAEMRERQTGIRVASVSPGTVRTPLIERLVANNQFTAADLEAALEPISVAKTMMFMADAIERGEYIADILIT